MTNLRPKDVASVAGTEADLSEKWAACKEMATELAWHAKNVQVPSLTFLLQRFSDGR